MKATILKGLMITALALVISSVLAMIGLGRIAPDMEMPVHWGLDGPDRFVTGSEAGPFFWLFPGIVALLGLILSLAPMLEPFRENLAKSRKAYFATWVVAVVFVVFLQAAFVSVAAGLIDADAGFGRWIVAAVSIMLIVIGNYLPKTRPNFLMGIRTPWTLTSATAWEKTHRLGGPLFIFAGTVGLLGAAVFDAPVGVLILPIVATPMAIGLLVYSWMVWRNSDDRIRPSEFIKSSSD